MENDKFRPGEKSPPHDVIDDFLDIDLYRSVEGLPPLPVHPERAYYELRKHEGEARLRMHWFIVSAVVLMILGALLLGWALLS